jgi:hypothetical protein
MTSLGGLASTAPLLSTTSTDQRPDGVTPPSLSTARMSQSSFTAVACRSEMPASPWGACQHEPDGTHEGGGHEAGPSRPEALTGYANSRRILPTRRSPPARLVVLVAEPDRTFCRRVGLLVVCTTIERASCRPAMIDV